MKAVLTLMAGCTLMFLAGCSDKQMNPVSSHGQVQLNPADLASNPQAFPGEVGVPDSGYFRGGKIYFSRINGVNVWQGDIILADSLITQKPGLSKIESAIRTTHLWPASTAFYIINGDLHNQARVTDAMNHWRSVTNMDFVPRTNETNYIRFQQDPNGGCWSSGIGMVGGEQIISLADWGTTGSVIHEIGHSANLFHEQTRPDGDNVNIIIVWANISRMPIDWWPQFYPYTTFYADGANNGNYDFNSIMHYSCFSLGVADGGCAINPNNPIITKLNGTTWTANNTNLSAGDIAGINYLYQYNTKPIFVLDAYGCNQGWSDQLTVPRMVADVNSDQRADIIGFATNGVYVSLSQTKGSSFGAPSMWIASYGYNQGWTSNNTFPRVVADVNNDQSADIIGFASDGVYVSLSTGYSFGAPSRWIANYGYNHGWTSQDVTPRMVADVNNDQRADIIGFATNGVYVSLSTGSSFGAPSMWIASYGYNQGWTSNNTFPRVVADVNNDYRADIVGFASNGVSVSLSSGTSFGTQSIWIASFGYYAGGWTSNDLYPRCLADVNGDNRADIIGYGGSFTFLSLSTGTSYSTPPVIWTGRFSSDDGWTSQNSVPRSAACLFGNDNKADLIGFATNGVYVLTNRRF